MATVTFHGNPVTTAGDLPAIGSTAPDFQLTGTDLADVTLSKYAGKKKILSIVPSLDTGVCATSAKKFNEAIANFGDVVLLNISADLPFAAGRFCESNNLKNIVTLSTFRAPTFGQAYGVGLVSGAVAGLTARAIVVLDADNKVVHTELVPEIGQEPNYDAALAAVK